MKIKKFCMKKTKTLLILSVIFIDLAFCFLALAWTEPSLPPPQGNVPAPINVSGEGQVKLYEDDTHKGWLGIATDGYDPSYGLTVGNSTNQLGIKTSGDSYFEGDLTIRGNLKLNNVADNIYFEAKNSTSQVVIGFTGPYGSQFHERLHISSGSAGGTNWYTYAVLGIEDNDHTYINIRTPNDKYGGIIFSDPDDFYSGSINYDHSTDEMSFTSEKSISFAIAGNTAFVIDSSGNVGMGVSSPTEKLEVNGAIKIGNTTNTNAGTIRWTGSDFEGYTGTEWVSLTGGTGGATTFLQLTDTPSSYSGYGGYVVKVKADETGLEFGTVGGYWTQSGTSLYPNNASWDVGIGLTGADSNYRLTVEDKGVKITNTGTSYSFYVEDENNDSTPFVIDSSGNVGIKESSPQYTLDINGALRLQQLSGWDPPGANGVMYYDEDINKFRCFEGGVWKDCISAGTGGATTFLQLTDTPSSYSGYGGYVVKVKADETGLEFGTVGGGVSGSGVANKLAIWLDGETLTYDTYLHWNNTYNRLGINTSSPTKTLDVNGGVRIRGLDCSSYGNGGKITTDSSGNLICASDTGGGNVSGSGGSGAVAYWKSLDTITYDPYFTYNETYSSLKIGNISYPADIYKLAVKGNAKITGYVQAEGYPAFYVPRAGGATIQLGLPSQSSTSPHGILFGGESGWEARIVYHNDWNELDLAGVSGGVDVEYDFDDDVLYVYHKLSVGQNFNPQNETLYVSGDVKILGDLNVTGTKNAIFELEDGRLVTTSAAESFQPDLYFRMSVLLTKNEQQKIIDLSKIQDEKAKDFIYLTEDDWQVFGSCEEPLLYGIKAEKPQITITFDRPLKKNVKLDILIIGERSKNTYDSSGF